MYKNYLFSYFLGELNIMSTDIEIKGMMDSRRIK
jgi:hypothetical protein